MERSLAVLMVQAEIGHAAVNHEEKKPATVVTVDVWSSMRLQQVSFAWHRELWLLHEQTVLRKFTKLQQRMFWMLLKRATK